MHEPPDNPKPSKLEPDCRPQHRLTGLTLKEQTQVVRPQAKDAQAHTHRQGPQDPSGEPAQFAIEVNANLLAKLGVKPGDHVEIPDLPSASSE